jgi:hypothetical protein
MKGGCFLYLLAPQCHLAVFRIIGVYSIHNTLDVFGAGQTAEEGEKLVDLFFVPFVLCKLGV